MLAEIERHGGVEIIIQGIAASAASLIAIGGAKIAMHPAAVFMIHEPASISFGSSLAHHKNAETLEKLTEVYAGAYSRASGNPLDLIKQWMAEETWLDADEAVALNFWIRLWVIPIAKFCRLLHLTTPNSRSRQSCSLTSQ